MLNIAMPLNMGSYPLLQGHKKAGHPYRCPACKYFIYYYLSEALGPPTANVACIRDA